MRDTPVLPSHVEDTVQAIAEVHLQHHRQTSQMQRAVDRLTTIVGRPRFIFLMTALLVAWVVLNLLLGRFGQAFDAPPFQWLQDASTLLALYITVLILITQRRENILTEQREQLTLELAMLSEKRTAKIISLLEELRRDHPQIRDRIDREADDMAQNTDTQAVLRAIRDTQDGAEPSA